MKKHIFIWLLLIACLTSGCHFGASRTDAASQSAEVGAETTGSWTETTEHSQTTERLPIGKNAPQFLPLCEDAFLVQPNFDLDLYLNELGGSGFVHFEILSKGQLNPEKISLTFPELDGYEAKTEIDELCFDGRVHGGLQDLSGREYIGSDEVFSYPLFLCYQNTDWSGIAELAEAVRRSEAEVELLRKQGGDTAALHTAEAALESAERAYFDGIYAEKDAYTALPPERLPQFYYYSVNVDFLPIGAAEDETVQLGELRVGTATYSFSLGRIRLQPDTPVASASNGQEMEYATYSSGWEYRHCGAENGLRMDGAFLLFPSPDPVEITLEAFHFFRTDSGASDFHIWLGNGMDFSWDGQSPLAVSTGEELRMELYMTNPNLLTPYADVLDFGILDYRCDGQEGSFVIPMIIHYHRTPYELYAECFDGVDLEGYYEAFYAKYPDAKGNGMQ